MDKLKSSETEELIQMVKSGVKSDEAFSELHSRYEPLINSRVNAFFGSGAVVSEAKQEASIALHNAVMSYNAEKCDGVTFGLFASICISNKLKTFYKQNAKETAILDRFSEADKLVSGFNLESRVATVDFCERVMKIAKSLLSDFEYKVFRLSFEQYATKDIAALLGKTPKSIDNAKNRISRRLRENEEICFILSDIK